MREVVPAILATTSEELTADFELVRGLNSYVHVDIADGGFVDVKTVEPEEILHDIDPHEVELHLMTREPLALLEDTAGTHWAHVVVHAEVITGDAKEFFAKLASLAPEAELGVALNPASPVSLIEEFLPYVQIVMLMSVEPGSQGSPFIPETTAKLTELIELREKHAAKFVIEIDGGLKTDTIRDVIAADRFVVGSAIVRSKNPKASYDALLSAASEEM